MRTFVRGVMVVGLLLTLAPWAHAKPNRSGFTGDLGVGVAVTFTQSSLPKCGDLVCEKAHLVAKDGGTVGFAPLSFSLGGFVSRRVAVLARSTGTVFASEGTFYSHDFVGPIVEVWPADIFYFSAGAGLGIASRNSFFVGTGDDKTAGWALDLRAGLALLRKTNHDLTLSLEVIPSFYRRGDVKAQTAGGALVVAWKWY